MTRNRYVDLSQYELLHLPAHLAGSERVADLRKLLTDEEFLEHKVESAMVLDLISDLSLAVNRLPPESQWSQFLKTVHDAISRDVDFISRHPSTLFQTLWNLCWWHDTREAANHYLQPSADVPDEVIPSVAPSARLHSWMEEWRRRKDGKTDFIWVRQYRPPADSLSAPLTKELKGHSYVVRCVSFCPSGKYLVSGSPSTPGEKTNRAELVLWDAATGLKLNSLNLEALSAAYSPDGHNIVVTTFGGAVQVIDAKTFKQESEYRIGDHQPRIAKYSPDNDYIIVGCYDGTVFRLSVHSGEVTDTLCEHKGVVAFADYTDDGESIVTGSIDGIIQISDADSCTLRKVINTSHKLGALDISPDGEVIASANAPEDTLRWTEDETQITLWDVSTGYDFGRLIGHASPVNCLAFSPDGKYLLSGAGTYLSNQDNSVRLWEIETRREIKSFTGHSSGITEIDFSPEGRIFASSSWDRTVRIWSIDEASSQPRLPNHTGDVFGLSFSPDGRWLVSSAWDDLRILLWDAETGRLLHAMEGHESLIRCFRFSDDSQYLVSGSGSKYHGVDCTVRLWHVETGKQVAVFEGEADAGEWHGHVNPIKIVGFSQDGRHIISGHADLLSFTQAVSIIRVWDRHTGELIDCSPGSGEQAYEMIKSQSEEMLLQVWESGVDKTGETLYHPLCGDLSDLSNVKTISGWTGQRPVGLEGRANEIAIRTYQGEVAWLPEQLGLSIAASRSDPRWALGRGNHLVIFGLEGALATLPGMTSFREASKQSLRVELGDLFDAISRGNLSIVRDLITTDHNIAKACDSEGITPLHKLAEQPLVEAADEIALALLHGGADPNAGDVSGVTPLHWLSCRPWGIGVAQILLEWGANPMAEDNQGHTPFASALRTSFMFGSAMVTLLNRYRYGR